jgi:Mg/Co/Ni transporter MgtE
MGLHELKSFCTTKETVTRLKRQHTEWKKIFASYTSDKRFITRIYRALQKPNYQSISDPMKKWANELHRTFSREEVQMAKKQ